MKVYDALAIAFALEGTTDVFGMMGDANMHWINAMVSHGVRVYNVRHEGGALGMADGWARSTGQPGVATTTCGPGVTQLSTTMIVASRARSPIVAFCGETAVGDDDDTQFFNVERYAAAVECGFVRVAKPHLTFDAVQRAFYIARSESRPVILSAPEDVQRSEFEDEQTYVPAMRLIGDSRLAPSPGDVEKAASLLGASERVVVVVGDGARRAGVDDLVLEFHELTHALVATTLRAKNWLRQKTDFHAGISGLFATKSAIDLLQQADCVVAIGASLNRYTIEHGYLYPTAKYIHIDVRPHLTMGNGALADCYIQADARLMLEQLNRALRSRPTRSAGYHTIQVRDSLAAALEDPEEFDPELGAVDPRGACRVIDEELGKDVGLVIGSSYQSAFGAFLLSEPRRDVLINYGYFGAIGQALILGIGAVVASGYRPTVVIDGDASFMMYLSEFETACRYQMPLLVVVFNDQALGAESHKSALYGLNPELTFIRTPDLGQVAASLGGRGVLVREPEEFRAALRDFTDSPAPTVIDLRVARNVTSITDRRLHFGADV
jgi:thiamine pyrophosphate-dependent acetolactate synthase large subunit-like protein